MLLYLVVVGYNLYVKFVYIYLIEMCELEEIYFDVYSFFVVGYYVVCRFNKYWVGLFIDLLIEQILMCSLKIIGGLIRGRGMFEY